MAQTNYTPISLYYSTTASAVPTAANLVQGELAINTNDGKLYYEDSSGVVQVLATKSTGSIGGSNTQVQFNNSGSLGGSSSFTWDGTTVTATKFAGALNGTVGATTASTGAFTSITASTTLGITGVATFSAGTVALPAITTTGDTNTGIFFPAADTIAFTEGGAESMRIDSSGNVGIGTSTAGTRLVLATDDTATTGQLRYARSVDVTYFWETGRDNQVSGDFLFSNAVGSTKTERMRITSAGLVGIGDSSPGQKLVVSSADTDRTSINLVNTSSGGGNFNIGAIGSAGLWDASAGSLVIRDSSAGVTRVILNSSGNLGLGSFAPSAWRTTDRVFEIGSVGKGLSAPTSGNSVFLATNWYVNTTPANVYAANGLATRYAQSDGVHTWSTAANNTSGAGAALTFTQAMTLDASGNLLVGTTDSGSTSGNGLKVTAGSGNADSVSVVTGATTNAGLTTYQLYSTGAGAYRFYVGGGGTIFATSATISAISDERLKENVRDIDTGLDAVLALKPRRFDWKEGKGQDKKNAAGFIAQEYQEVLPNSISTFKQGDDGIDYLTMNHEELIPTLVKAIQELKAEFDAYKVTHP